MGEALLQDSLSAWHSVPACRTHPLAQGRSPRAGNGRSPSPAGISPCLPGGPISPFSPGIPVAPSRPSRPSLPGKPWPPCRPGVPGMPGCPEHSPGILLSSICKDLLMSPRRKRRKSCFILSWRGWKGAEKDHSSGDRSEEGWECLAGKARGSAGDIPLFSSLYNLGCSPQRGPSAVCTCHSIPVARVPSQHPAAPRTAQDVCGVWGRARGCASGFVCGWGLFGVGTAPSCPAMGERAGGFRADSC